MLIDFVLLTLVWRIKSWLLKIKSMITWLLLKFKFSKHSGHLQLSKHNVRVKGLTRKEIFCWPKYVINTKEIILQNTHYTEFYFFFAVPCFCDTSGDFVTSIFMFLTDPEGERDGDLATSILMLLTDPEGDRDFLCDISPVWRNLQLWDCHQTW